MPIKDEIAKLKSIQKEANELFDVFKDLAESDKKAPAPVLTQLTKLVDSLDASARQAARDRRKALIEDLSERIRQYDVLLALNLSPNTRAATEAERATLVAQRGYHRGRLGLDFEGIVSKAEAEKLTTLVKEVKAAARAKKKAVEYIDAAIRIGMVAAKIIGKIAA